MLTYDVTEASKLLKRSRHLFFEFNLQMIGFFLPKDFSLQIWFSSMISKRFLSQFEISFCSVLCTEVVFKLWAFQKAPSLGCFSQPEKSEHDKFYIFRGFFWQFFSFFKRALIFMGKNISENAVQDITHSWLNTCKLRAH